MVILLVKQSLCFLNLKLMLFFVIIALEKMILQDILICGIVYETQKNIKYYEETQNQK